MSKGLWAILGCVLMGSGCWRDSEALSFPVHVATPDRTAAALLLSEVQQADVPAELLNADFLLENRSSAPQTVMLSGKSCSCYGVSLDGAPLELHDPVTIPPSSSRVLTLDVAPPDQAVENSWLVRLASRDEPGRELKLSLRVRVYADVRLEPDAIVTVLPSDFIQQGSQTSPELRHALSIRRTWRGNERDTAVPSLSGLPTGWGYSPPVISEEPREVDAGMWQETWQTEVQFPAPSSGVVGHPLAIASNNREVRLKVTPPEGQFPVGRPTLTTFRQAVGVHRMRVSFEDRVGKTFAAHGRFVVREPPGITCPTVVHWGNITVGESRSRRIMLSASDGRAFTVSGVLQSRTQRAGQVGEDPTGDVAIPSATEAGQRVWNLRSTDLELRISLDVDVSRTHQGLQLDVVPLQEGSIDETIVLKTDHPLTPTIEVRVRAIVVPVDKATAKGDS